MNVVPEASDIFCHFRSHPNRYGLLPFPQVSHLVESGVIVGG